jgi:hypothetical protein
MLNRLLSSLLLLLLAIGILIAWVPGGFLWHLAECVVFGLMLAWLAGWSAGKLEVRWSWQFVLFLGIVALGCLQLWRGWTVYPFATAQDILRWAVYAVVFFLAFQLFAGEDSVRTFRRLFLFYALAIAVESLLQWFGNGKIFGLFDAPELGGMGPFLNRDHYSTFVSVALPMGVAAMFRQPRHRWVYIIASAALYASVIAGGSRAGFILVTVELFLLFALVEFSGRMAVAAVALILLFGTVVGWDYLYGRFNEHDPYAGRREVAAATLTMVKASPAHGFGLGTWTTVYPAFASKDFGVFINAAHNDWLQWGSDGGVPMLACILALFAGSLAMVRRVPWALGVPIAFVHCLIDFPMQGRFLPAVVFLVFGIAARAALRLREEPSKPRRSRESLRQLTVSADAL